MNTVIVAQKIKKHLIQLAVDDKLPLDLEGLDMQPIVEILNEAEDEDAFGFSYEDVLEQAKDDEVELTEEEAREVILLLRRTGGDASIGVNWETISYFIELYKSDKNNE